MTRRLFFLFPDRGHAETAVTELVANGIPRNRLHAVARTGIPLTGLPTSPPSYRNDLLGRLDRALWHVNLGMFWVALAVFAVALLSGSFALAAVMAAVMVASFLFGLYQIRLPHTHLRDLNAALLRGEIVLMVDVAKEQIPQVERLVHRRHPESVVGGVCWSHPAWGM